MRSGIKIDRIRDYIKEIAVWLVPLSLYGNILLNAIAVLFGTPADCKIRIIIIYGSLMIAALIFCFCTDYRKVIYELFVSVLWFSLYIYRYFFIYSSDIALFLKSEFSGIVLSIIFWGGILFLSQNLIKAEKTVNIYIAVVGTIASIYLVYSAMYVRENNFFEWIDYLSLASLFLHFLIVLYIYISNKELSKISKIYVSVFAFFIAGAIIQAEAKRKTLGLLFLLLVMIIESLLRKTKKNIYFIIVCSIAVISFYVVSSKDTNSRYNILVEEMNSAADNEEMNSAADNEEMNSAADNEEINSVSENTTEIAYVPEFLNEKKSFKTIELIIKWSQDVYYELETIKGLHSKYAETKDGYLAILKDYIIVSEMIEDDYYYGIISQKEYTDIKNNYNFLMHTSIGARLYLYGNALYEFRNSPILGNGLMHFLNKYGDSPHCILLELMSDFGLLGVAVIMTGFFICIKRFWKLSLLGTNKRLFVDFLIVYTLCTLPDDIFGGSIYSFLSMTKYVLGPVLCIKEKNHSVHDKECC